MVHPFFQLVLPCPIRYSDSGLLCVDEFLDVAQGLSLCLSLLWMWLSFSLTVASGEIGVPSSALAKILTPLCGAPRSLSRQIPHSYGSISPQVF